MAQRSSKQRESSIPSSVESTLSSFSGDESISSDESSSTSDESGSSKSSTSDESGSSKSSTMDKSDSQRRSTMDKSGSQRRSTKEKSGSQRRSTMDKSGSQRRSTMDKSGSQRRSTMDKSGSRRGSTMDKSGSRRGSTMDKSGSRGGSIFEESDARKRTTVESGSLRRPSLSVTGSMVSPSVDEPGSLQRSTLEDGGSKRPTLGRVCSIQWASKEEPELHSGSADFGLMNQLIDSILRNGCITHCSVNKETGALRLYVQRNTRYSLFYPSTRTRNDKTCKVSGLHLGYRQEKEQPLGNIRGTPKRNPISSYTTNRTQIVKEQDVQTEITISADVDMWKTREYCRCDLRCGRSETPPPRSPRRSKPLKKPAKRRSPQRKISSEPSFYQAPPLREVRPREALRPQEVKPSPPAKKAGRKMRRNSRLSFIRNYNIAFQKITLNPNLLNEKMHNINNYYVTQDPNYDLKFENSRYSLRNARNLKRIKNVTEYRPEDRKYKERPGFMSHDDRLYLAWNAFCDSFLKHLAEQDFRARRDERPMPVKFKAKRSKEVKKCRKDKEGQKSQRGKEGKKLGESKKIKKQEDNKTSGRTKKRRAVNNVQRLGFVN